MKQTEDIWLVGYVAGSYALECVQELREELLLRYAPFYIDNGVCQIGKDMKEAALVLENIQTNDEISVGYYENIGKDGIFNALWKLGEEKNAGLRVYLDEIPIRQFSIEMAEYKDENPYEQSSEAAYILITKASEELLRACCTEEMRPVRIGQLTTDKARIIINGENTRYLKFKEDW